jgi:hypothetical protein
MGERLGYVVVCFNQASGQDLASGDVLYDDAADAMGCRDGGSGPRSLAGVTAMSSPRSSNWVRTVTVTDPVTLSCGHDRALSILRRDGAAAWCFVCEKHVEVSHSAPTGAEDGGS